MAREAGVLSRAALALTVGLLGACAGAPWFLGHPREPTPVVPSADLNPGLAELRARRLDAVNDGRPWKELALLRALARRDDLRPAERARFVALLRERLLLWQAEARPRAELAVRLELAAVSPSAKEASAEARRETAARAARSWWRLGDRKKADELARLAGVRGGTAEFARPPLLLLPCRPGPDDPCALPALTLPAAWFAVAHGARDAITDAATLTADEVLLTRETLTEAFRAGGLSFVRRMAFHPEVDSFLEALREEDDTATFTWETVGLLELFRGHQGSAERAFLQAVVFNPSRAEEWAWVAEAWEAAGQLPRACAAWRRAAAVHDDAWDPRWQRLLRCLEAAPAAGDALAWKTFLQEKVDASLRLSHAQWLGGVH